MSQRSYGCCDVSVSCQKVHFLPVFADHTNTPSRRYQIYPARRAFQKVPFSVTENTVLVWSEGQLAENELRLQLYSA